jgi:hypothetical protein
VRRPGERPQAVVTMITGAWLAWVVLVLIVFLLHEVES